MSQAWKVDRVTGIAKHQSGLTLAFTQVGGQVQQITPRQVPKDMPSIKMVRLIREGMEAIEASPCTSGSGQRQTTASPSGTNAVRKASSQKLSANGTTAPVVVKKKRRFAPKIDT